MVEHLGAAQFAVPATVDRLRSYAEDTQIQKPEPVALALAATDPANPYGAALPWRKTAKDTWRVETGLAARLIVRSAPAIVTTKRIAETAIPPSAPSRTSRSPRTS